MSIGIEKKDGKMDIIFKKNSPLTLFSERNYSYDSEKPLIIKLCAYEGENEIAKKNIKIGEYHFNLKPVNNKIEFKLKFFLENYILKVQKIQENNQDEEIIINDENNLSQNEINEINKNNLCNCLNTKNSVTINSSILSNILTLKNIINSTDDEKTKFEDYIKWLKDNVKDYEHEFSEKLKKENHDKNKILEDIKNLCEFYVKVENEKPKIQTQKLCNDLKDFYKHKILNILQQKENKFLDIYPFLRNKNSYYIAN
jgi:hypothetical protein